MEMFGFERRINNNQQYQYYYQYHHHNRDCNINDDNKNNSKNHNNNDGDSIKQINYKKFHNDLLLSVTDAIKPATKIATIAAISTPINTILTNGTTDSTATVSEKLKNYKNSLLSSSSSSLPLPLSSSKKLFLNDDHNDSKLNSIKKFDKTLLRTVLIGTVIIIIIYKIIQFSLPYTADRTENMELSETFRIIYSKVSNQMENFLSSSTLSSSSSTTTITNFMYSGLITSLLCGIAFTIYTGLIVYMDSYVPGINPPIPFISKSGYSKNKWNPPYIGYLTAIAGGIVVSCLMYFDF